MATIPICLSLLASMCGCETYRIEYHERPAFYQKASATKLPDRVTLEDGTVIVYNQKDAKGLAEDVGEEFKIREQDEDGNVTLRAMLPEHVLSNTLTCIKNREYELLWDQMVSERTKLAYESQGEGYEEFEAYMRKNRLELARSLTRMVMGIPRQEVILSNYDDGRLVYRFRPHVAPAFAFTKVMIVGEELQLKLLTIR